MLPPSSPVRGRWHRLSIAAVAITLPLAAAVVPFPTQAQPERPAAPESPSATHRVTLVTGDVVTVRTLADGRQIADVDRPADAVGGVRIQENQGDLFVVPDEAVALLGAGKLDPRLFDVTGLIEMGYDDAGTSTVPVIATYTRAASRAPGAPSAPQGSRPVRELSAIQGAALSTPKPQARTFWTAVAPTGSSTDPTPSLRGGVTKLWLDGRVEAALKESVPQIGAPEAWAAGYDGTGVDVAVLDSGIDVAHPDLVDQIDDTASFVPGEDLTDVNGHGTHVASTIVGTGAASGGDYQGVAPGADLLVGKVLGGPEGFGQDSWVIAGMEWAAESGAEIVNLSLGDTVPSDGSDPMAQAVDALSAEHGTLFVIASGNSGPETVSTPGTAASALTVGAVDKQDALAYFSSTGPVYGSGALKPDIVAPGVDITAARSQDMADGETGLYRTISGTSMATPHVAGAAAILAQRHPGWTGEQLKEQLMSSALGLPYSPYEVGTGRVDVAAALTNTVRGTGSLFFGNYDWPHEPSDTAVTKDLTFTNDGAADVTLSLELTVADGAFELGAASVTVPAGGQATVPVTGDPQAVELGRFAGYVIGTDAATGEPVTRTSVALIKEEERYDLHVKLVGRDGQPASGWVGFSKAGEPWPWSEFVDGEATLRMPPGSYALTANLDVAGEGPDRSGVAVLVDPETVLDQSSEVVLDASRARLLETTAPQRTEDRQRKIDFSIVDETGVEFRSAYGVPLAYDDLYVSPTEPMTEGSFILTTRWRKGEPMLTLDVPGGGDSFDTIVQPGSPLGTGSDTAPTVYAGNGAAADYAAVDAEGRVAVVNRSDAVTPVERAEAAAAAGAEALVVVNDGRGGLLEYVGDASIPVVSVHRDAGAELVTLATSGAPLTVRQAEHARYIYDLTRDYPGQVPDRPLVYAPTQRDLARIDSRFYAVRGGDASGYRYDLTLSPSFGFEEREWHPGTRVEWVTPGQQWVETHAQNIGGTLPWSMSSGVNTFAKRTTTRHDWFRPATAPGFSDSFGVVNSRWQDYMTWNVQPWSSSSARMDLGGYLPWGETPTHLRVFQGDRLIHDNPHSADMQWVEVPAGKRSYRAVVDAERPGTVFGLSTRTHTEWTFVSDTVDSERFEPFSVLRLDYRLDSDLRGDIRAGARHRIAIRPGSSDLGRLPGKVTRATLAVSFDGGGTWRPVALHKRASGWWGGGFRAPKNPRASVAVRAGAATGKGYSIKQTIIRAYGLR